MDRRAASGFARGAVEYERGRPGYPREGLAHVVSDLGLTAASTVLDLAAGTGKLTRALLPLVGRAVAVEPSEEMLEQLRAQVPDVEARQGIAEAIPLADGAVDAVFVGEAFHWFDVVAAAREIARVLRPGGGLAVVFQRARWAEHGGAWVGEFDALVHPYREGAGSFPAGDGAWKAALERTGGFEPWSELALAYDHRVTADEFVALVASWSWIANLPDARRREVLAAARRLVAGHAPVTLRYRTEFCWARVRGA